MMSLDEATNPTTTYRYVCFTTTVETVSDDNNVQILFREARQTLQHKARGGMLDHLLFTTYQQVHSALGPHAIYGNICVDYRLEIQHEPGVELDDATLAKKILEGDFKISLIGYPWLLWLHSTGTSITTFVKLWRRPPLPTLPIDLTMGGLCALYQTIVHKYKAESLLEVGNLLFNDQLPACRQFIADPRTTDFLINVCNFLYEHQYSIYRQFLATSLATSGIPIKPVAELLNVIESIRTFIESHFKEFAQIFFTLSYNELLTYFTTKINTQYRELLWTGQPGLLSLIFLCHLGSPLQLDNTPLTIVTTEDFVGMQQAGFANLVAPYLHNSTGPCLSQLPRDAVNLISRFWIDSSQPQIVNLILFSAANPLTPAHLKIAAVAAKYMKAKGWRVRLTISYTHDSYIRNKVDRARIELNQQSHARIALNATERKRMIEAALVDFRNDPTNQWILENVIDSIHISDYETELRQFNDHPQVIKGLQGQNTAQLCVMVAGTDLANGMSNWNANGTPCLVVQRREGNADTKLKPLDWHPRKLTVAKPDNLFEIITKENLPENLEKLFAQFCKDADITRNEHLVEYASSEADSKYAALSSTCIANCDPEALNLMGNAQFITYFDILLNRTNVSTEHLPKTLANEALSARATLKQLYRLALTRQLKPEHSEHILAKIRTLDGFICVEDIRDIISSNNARNITALIFNNLSPAVFTMFLKSYVDVINTRYYLSQNSHLPLAKDMLKQYFSMALRHQLNNQHYALLNLDMSQRDIHAAFTEALHDAFTNNQGQFMQESPLVNALLEKWLDVCFEARRNNTVIGALFGTFDTAYVNHLTNLLVTLYFLKLTEDLNVNLSKLLDRKRGAYATQASPYAISAYESAKRAIETKYPGKKVYEITRDIAATIYLEGHDKNLANIHRSASGGNTLLKNTLQALEINVNHIEYNGNAGYSLVTDAANYDKIINIYHLQQLALNMRLEIFSSQTPDAMQANEQYTKFIEKYYRQLLDPTDTFLRGAAQWKIMGELLRQKMITDAKASEASIAPPTPITVLSASVAPTATFFTAAAAASSSAVAATAATSPAIAATTIVNSTENISCKR